MVEQSAIKLMNGLPKRGFNGAGVGACANFKAQGTDRVIGSALQIGGVETACPGFAQIALLGGSHDSDDSHEDFCRRDRNVPAERISAAEIETRQRFVDDHHGTSFGGVFWADLPDPARIGTPIVEK